MKKLVIFDLGGVLFQAPFHLISQYEEEMGIPKGTVVSVIRHGQPDNAFAKLEKGELTTSQFVPLFEKECREYAAAKQIDLPQDLNVARMFSLIHAPPVEKESKPIESIINAARAIRNEGVKTCVLSNIWYHDNHTEANIVGTLYCWLQNSFDRVFLSCELGLRKPDPEIYKHVCQEMGVDPSEAVFLDDLGQNVKAAQEFGIESILVKEAEAADVVAKLQDILGFNITKKMKPNSCDPEKVSHNYVKLRTGIKIHYVEMGQGPCVILLHGFPQIWYFWTYQITALAAAGFRVIAPDLRGYGETESPYEIEAYTWKNTCEDIIALMDSLFIPQATVVGQDWGGVTAFCLALHYPDRICAVASQTPLIFSNPEHNPLDILNANPDGPLSYQLYFMQEGKAEVELAANTKRTMSVIVRTFSSMMQLMSGNPKATQLPQNVLKRGGLLVGFPEEVPAADDAVITEKDLDYISKQFEKSGFRGGLNWYRNHETNWRWNFKIAGRTVHQPCLKMTVGHDRIITPESWGGMHKLFEIPNLTEVHFPDLGHWASMEDPEQMNKALISWLKKVHTLPSKI